ncbi:MAG TPA: glycosyltransferase family 39 protein [Patescibacteria group bacterium]
MKKIVWLLVVIVALAAFLRFFQIGQNPPSLTWDETAWGYNAYALGTTAKDEFGRFLPHDYLESFGDFKPPVYAYADILPVKLLGLNEFATRFPSAFFGTLTVLITFFLVRQLFKKSPNKDWYGLMSAFVLAVSPWHIMLSRAAFEQNVATFFVVAGIWLFLKAVQENMWYLSLSAISFVITMYTFNSPRVVSPLLVLLLGISYFKTLWKYKKQTIIAGIIGLILFLPTAKFLLSSQAALRYQQVNIFSDVSLVQTSNQEIANDHNVWWSKIIHNRRLIYAAAFMQHYFDNLNPGFLFIHGDGNPKFSTQDTGEMYLWDIPFFILGILFLLKKKEGAWYIIPLWLLLGIIPAATARETPHALRIENSLPTFQIFVAYGFVQLMLTLKKNKKLIGAILFALLFVNVLYFEHGYYTHYINEYADQWQFGYKDAFSYTTSVQDKYSKIEFTDALGRPYIYYLFYSKTDPNVFKKTANITRDVFGFVHVNSVGKYFFPKDIPQMGNNTLFVNIPSNVPNNAHVQKTFYLPNGNVSLVAYTL